MKSILAGVIIASIIAVSAGEREDLLKTFEKENKAANQSSDSATTTVELTSAAGSYSNLAESQLFRALDYKLRNTANAKERLRIIENFYTMSQHVKMILETPRDSMGSMAGMQIYYAAANLKRQHTKILMLDAQAEKRWKQIADATFVLNKQKIKLTRGLASFETVMYDSKTTLEIILFPHDTFSYGNRHFAIIRPDIPFSVNDDFSTVYLCELKNGKLVVHTKYKHPYVSKWTLRGNKLILQYGKQKTEIVL